MKKLNYYSVVMFIILSGFLLLTGCKGDKNGGSDSADRGSGAGNSTDYCLPGTDCSNNSGDLRMLFAGDVMLARNVATVVDNAYDGNYSFPFLKVADYMKKADLTFVNLEGPISDKGFINLLKSLPHFRAVPQAVEGLLYAGVDVVSLANNHIFDYGRDAMEDCMNILNNSCIRYTGAGFTHEEAYGPLLLKVNGVKIAFLSYTNHGSPEWRAKIDYTDEYGIKITDACSGVAWLYIKQLERGIYAAREMADIVVVSLHFGEEYATLPSTAQDRYAHLAIDRGAHLVVGHHPHTTQPVMVYNKGYIAYSLGNFIFDQHEGLNKGVTRGLVLDVEVQDKKISTVKARYVKINENTWQPRWEEPVE